MFALGPMAAHAAAPDQSLGVTALTHVRVIDGTGHPPLEDATIVIQGDHILAIHAGTGALPSGARVLDLHGDTVMPGLINAHGHLALVAGWPELRYGLHRGKRARGIAAVRELRCDLDVIAGGEPRSALLDPPAATSRQAGWSHGFYGRPRYRCSGRRSALARCPGSGLPPGDSGRSPRRSGRVGQAACRHGQDLGR